MKMDQERYENWADMVHQIALRASKELFSRTPEDIEQDLWVKILETEARKGHEIDKSLAARVCWDYVNDMKDYDQRRNHFATDLSGSDESEEYDDTNFIGARPEKGTSWASDLDLKGLYNKFPSGSKERIFLDFYGGKSNVLLNPEAVPPESREQDGYNDSALAKMLGFKTRRSFIKFKEYMKNVINDYLKTQ